MNEHCRGCIRYLKSCSGMTKAVCEKHQLRIPRTNADRIRAMTDEELADFLAGIEHDACCASTYLGNGTYIDNWLDWLREEAEE